MKPIWLAPSQPCGWIVKRPKGARASVVPGVADHRARQSRIMAARLHAYPLLSSGEPITPPQLFSPSARGRGRWEGLQVKGFVCGVAKRGDFV